MPSYEMLFRKEENLFLMIFVYTPTIRFDKLFIAESWRCTIEIDFTICKINSEATDAIFTIC